jgi:hypothetical protein
MFKTQEDVNRAQVAAAYENARKRMLEAAYAHNPLWVRCLASDKAIFQIFTDFAGHDVMPTFEMLQTALDVNPDAAKDVAQRSESTTRDILSAEILELLRKHGRGHDSWTLRSEETRLKAFSIEALYARRDALKSGAALARRPMSELKEMVAGQRQEPSMYPRLPETMWSSVQGRHIQIDAEYLNHLAANDKYEFVRLVKLYGSKAVDSRRGL